MSARPEVFKRAAPRRALPAVNRCHCGAVGCWGVGFPPAPTSWFCTAHRPPGFTRADRGEA